MYLDTCKEIREELGVLVCITFFDFLKRKDSLLTLWKVNYISIEDEVFWGISINRESFKIKDVHINW
jgi:hypothetical protein